MPWKQPCKDNSNNTSTDHNVCMRFKSSQFSYEREPMVVLIVCWVCLLGIFLMGLFWLKPLLAEFVLRVHYRLDSCELRTYTLHFSYMDASEKCKGRWSGWHAKVWQQNWIPPQFRLGTSIFLRVAWFFLFYYRSDFNTLAIPFWTAQSNISCLVFKNAN